MKRKRDSVSSDPSQNEGNIEQLTIRLSSASSITTQILRYVDLSESQSNSSRDYEIVNFVRSRVTIILELIQELMDELEFIQLEDHVVDTYGQRVNSIVEQALRCQDLLGQLPLKDHEINLSDPNETSTRASE
ncbi:14275_t:CDS:2 [Acaulospora colombiana]|uniref:14275_t:CDS:1 n=1 Tax=Acaulospora colombiana TaxID=27376 RepID=A0ACA9KMZ4_9GLOM|nr:14275_t:CDS:2 [Acaulospora colombiana]